MKAVEITHFPDKCASATELHWDEGNFPDVCWGWGCEKGKYGVVLLDGFGDSWEIS